MFHEYNFTLDSLYIVANALLFILAKWKNHYIDRFCCKSV